MKNEAKKTFIRPTTEKQLQIFEKVYHLSNVIIAIFSTPLLPMQCTSLVR
jgi:hypothetical protein